jgi:5-methylcytosine-specific restriction endonuclease McrA
MPYSPPSACSHPRCPDYAVRKGKCERHQMANDGYSPTWRATSIAVRREVGHCEDCGSTVDLTTDHLIPASLGGDDRRSNLRVRCRICHAKFGRKANSHV